MGLKMTTTPGTYSTSQRKADTMRKNEWIPLVWMLFSLIWCFLSARAILIFQKKRALVERMDGQTETERIQKEYGIHDINDQLHDEYIRFSQHGVSFILGAVALALENVPEVQGVYTFFSIACIFYLNAGTGANTFRAVADSKWKDAFIAKYFSHIDGGSRGQMDNANP
jgi:hypothetical protein